MPASVYTVAKICGLLDISRRSFYRLLKTGQLPMCEELQPRIGRTARYRAEPIDRYIAGQFFGTQGRRLLGRAKTVADRNHRDHEGLAAPESIQYVSR